MARLIFVLLTVILAIGYYTVYSNHMRARTGALHTGCCANLKNIGFALDDYRRHHNGIYPDSLRLQFARVTQWASAIKRIS